jgi:hypothetical protein
MDSHQSIYISPSKSYFLMLLSAILFMCAYILSAKVQTAVTLDDKNYYTTTSSNLFYAGIAFFVLPFTLNILLLLKHMITRK